MKQTRRKFIQTASATAAITVVGTACNRFGKPASHKTLQQLAQLKKPNILWISCEDIGTEIGCYGDTYADTPNIDKLATEGCLYRKAFVPVPVCAPTRSAIITGMYPGTLGSIHMRTADKGYEAVPPVGVKCFSEYLRAAGYYCINNEKTDYQFTSPFTAWDTYEGDWRNPSRPENAPFFAVINLMVTHESNCWNLEKLTHDPSKAIVPSYYPDTEIVRKNLARYYDNITTMDSNVGKILDKLEADGLAEDTIVFFWSDHGGLPRQKRWTYDAGLHVPLIVRYPGKIEPETTSDELVNFIDLAPTVLSLAGLPVPSIMQGQVFLGENKAPQRKYTFGGRNRMDEAVDFTRTARDSRYRYIRNFMPDVPYSQVNAYENQMPLMQEWRRLNQEGKLTEVQALYFQPNKPTEELYDLENDPYEINNLADLPEYKEKVAAMSQAVNDWMQETNDLGVLPEDELIQKMWGGTTQPITATPKVQRENISEETDRLTITCDTEGASIGYRIGRSKYWYVYQQPVEIPANSKVRAKAIRLGYRESTEVKA